MTNAATGATPQTAPAPSLLVVGGPMRGGTSMLRHLLASHPRVRLMALESRVLRYTDFATWAHCAAVHQASLSTVHRLLNRPFRRQVMRYLRGIVRGHALGELTTVTRIHRALVEALAGPDTAYVGDKYPDYVLQYPQFIHRADTKCVFVYRDARDVVASIHHRIHHGDWRGRTWARKYDTIEKATDYWLTVMHAFTDLQRLETNALAIRYEDLVRSPVPAIEAIARHLGLDAAGFDANMPMASSVGRSRERLTGAQVERIERRAGPVMEAWGYAPRSRA